MLAGRRPNIEPRRFLFSLVSGASEGRYLAGVGHELIQDCRVEGRRSGFWLTLLPVNMWMFYRCLPLIKVR